MSRTIEKPVVFGRGGSMVGLLTLPEAPSKAVPAVLLMNAGLIHRTGPHRLNVRIARRMAAQGFTVLRFDLRGFGDSRPRADKIAFRRATVADAREAMDFLTSSQGVEQFVPMGLCSGADLSLALAAEDERVVAALMIDSFAYVTRLFRLCRHTRWLLEPAAWLSGRDRLTSARQLAGKLATRLWPFASERNGASAPVLPWTMPPTEDVIRDVETAVARGVKLGFVYSGDAAFYNYLTRFYFAFRRLQSRGLIDVQRFKDADHVFTMTRHQRQLLDFVEDWTVKTAKVAELRASTARDSTLCALGCC